MGKHTDKSGKSTKDKEKKHKKETSSKSSAPEAAVRSSVVSAPSAVKSDELTTSGKLFISYTQLTFLDSELTKHFSPEYLTNQQALVLDLEKQLDVKFNNNLAKMPPYVTSLLAEKELATEVKVKLQKILSTITSLIQVETLTARVQEYKSKLELILKYQQDAAQHQVEIAAIPATCVEKQKYIDLNATHIRLISSTVNVEKDMLKRSTDLLFLINNINKCLAKPTFQPSAYGAGSSAMHTAQPAQPTTVKPEAITATGPGKGGKG